jgi:hypothetical protein
MAMIIVSANDNLFESLAPKVRINIAQGGALGIDSQCRDVACDVSTGQLPQNEKYQTMRKYFAKLS